MSGPPRSSDRDLESVAIPNSDRHVSQSLPPDIELWAEPGCRSRTKLDLHAANFRIPNIGTEIVVPAPVRDDGPQNYRILRRCHPPNHRPQPQAR